MRCALECSLEGKLRLPGDIDIAWFNGKRLTINRDKDGLVTRIRIEGKVAPDDLMFMKVIKELGKPLHFEARGGEKIRGELEAELQLLESTLGVFFGVTRIRWEYATSIAIPETPEEEAQVQWNNFSMRRSEDQPIKEPTLEDFECTLHMGYHARGLSTIMSFFREGASDLRTFRYISAFYSFYFVLEGLYANGKFGNKEVRAEFKKSTTLLDAITHVLTLPLYIQPPRIRGVVTIDEFLTMVQQPRTVDGVIHMLTWVRGDVHHFVNKPKRLTASPFTHHCYELLASFAHDICLNVLMPEILSRFPKSGESKII